MLSIENLLLPIGYFIYDLCIKYDLCILKGIIIIIICIYILLQINLRLILVSGKTKEFIFSPNDSAGDIAQAIFDNWPEGKNYFTYLFLIFYI